MHPPLQSADTTWHIHPPQTPVGTVKNPFLTRFSLMSDVVLLERGIPGRGSLDGSCEVMLRKCRRYINPCPGGRAKYQAVFCSCRLGSLPSDGRLMCRSTPGHGSIYRLHFLTITSHDPSSEPRPGMPRSNTTYDIRENPVRNGFLTVPTGTVADEDAGSG